jgi:DNA polymerase-3 subunit epsilon
MKVLIFDVETTGLMSERNASITQPDKWPYIVQLSYLIYDTVFNRITIINDDIIRLPDTVVMSDICIGIHGITNEKSKENGVDIRYALIKFNECLRCADLIVGHNLSFDKRLIMVECIRNNMKQNFTVNGLRKNEYCTMRNGIDICKIEAETFTGKKYFKYPKLSELYFHYFKIIPDGLHNSKKDVLVTLRCYCMMVYNYDICNYINLDDFEDTKKIKNVLKHINTNINIGTVKNDVILSDNILNEYQSSNKRQRIS